MEMNKDSSTDLRISIITVCYNAEQWIRQSIESVIRQNYKHIEYIVIDGDSQDATKQIIKEYSGKISQFTSEPDHGIFEAMNKGVRLATGDYLYFLGADDYLIDSQVMENAAAYLGDHPESDYLYGNIEMRSRPRPPFVYRPPPPNNLLDVLITTCLPHQASFIRKDLFVADQIGLFNENYKSGSDYEWLLRLAARCEDGVSRAVYFDRTIASYNADGTSGNIENALRETFEIQNRFPVYQREEWLKRRIEKYQQVLIRPGGIWKLYRLNVGDDHYDLKRRNAMLEAEMEKLQSTNETMAKGISWKLRQMAARARQLWRRGDRLARNVVKPAGN